MSHLKDWAKPDHSHNNNTVCAFPILSTRYTWCRRNFRLKPNSNT